MIYTWTQFQNDTAELAQTIRANGKQYWNVYGVPRGGTPLALALSYKLQVPIVSIGDLDVSTLVCDDVVHSGATRNRYILHDFVSLHFHPTSTYYPTYFVHPTDEWIEYPWEQAKQTEGEDIVRRMLEFIGESPDRPGLVDTPKRVVKMWKEIYRGYQEMEIPNITLLDNEDDGIAYHDMVYDSGYFFSFCEHHMVPMFGRYFFAYIANKKLIGLSKIGRLVDHFAARLQVAERLVHQVADHIMKEVEPEGLMLIMDARHLCKEMRGLRKFNSPAGVQAVRGSFVPVDAACRLEFMARIPKIGG